MKPNRTITTVSNPTLPHRNATVNPNPNPRSGLWLTLTRRAKTILMRRTCLPFSGTVNPNPQLHC